MHGEIVEIDYGTAVRFLLPKHYSGRTPQISRAFGLYCCNTYTDDNLKAVATFGKPASPFLCRGICGKQFEKSVYELNRLCRTEDWKFPLSQFVSQCLRILSKENWIVVSYSDTRMNHHGYIYQACNFIYTGCTKERTDKFVPNGGHARHYKEEEQNGVRKVRSAKHRYVYFCTKNRKLLKEWKSSLRYTILPYPKGDNSPDYVLGEYMKEVTTIKNKEVKNEKSTNN